MKSTAYFTRTILTFLEQRASTDALFAKSFANSDKNIDACCVYILNQVHKSRCNGFHDDEIFEIAVEYYTTDNIEVGKPMSNAFVVVNHVVELTAEEKEEARREAMQKAQDDAYNKMMRPKKKAKRVVMNNQPGLFDF